MPHSPARHRPRADATRNRKLLLVAAAEVFAEQGMDASIAEIADRAGIGKGTVFRHFASKDQLLAAIAVESYQGLRAVGESLLTAADPTTALIEFMTEAATMHVHNRTFAQISDQTFLATPEVAAAQTALTHVSDNLVERAQGHGGIRDDVTGMDIQLMLAGACRAAEPFRASEPNLWKRYLALVVDGLRPEGARPLPHRAPIATAWSRIPHGSYPSR